MTNGDLLKKVRLIEIKTRKLSHHIFSGHYHSAFKGRGMAFSEVREYQYGDDIRTLDWNVTARLNHPYIKVFEEERELTVMLLIDCSASNLFGSQKMQKSELITEIAAVLAFSAIHNNDKVGVIFFSDQVEKFIPPKKGVTHILRIIRELLQFQPQHKATNIGIPLQFLTHAIKKRSTAFILSDFQDNNFAEPLKIASKKHDLAAVFISDSLEKSLKPVGIIQIIDPETQEKFWFDTTNTSLLNYYQKEYVKFVSNTETEFIKAGVDFTHIETHSDYIKPLIQLFKMRERRL